MRHPERGLLHALVIASVGFVLVPCVSSWIVELPFMAGLGPERLAAAGWLCWTLPLLFTEIILQWRRTAGPRRQGA